MKNLGIAQKHKNNKFHKQKVVSFMANQTFLV
jgi:hypothetical protein